MAVDHSRIHDPRTVVNRRGVGRRRRKGSVSDRGRWRTSSLGTSTSGRQPMTLIEEEGSRANMGQERLASSEMEDMEARLSRPQPVLTQESTAGELTTSI